VRLAIGRVAVTRFGRPALRMQNSPRLQVESIVPPRQKRGTVGASSPPSLHIDSQPFMEKFLIRNEFGEAQELLGEEIVVPGFEELQFVLHAWLYDQRGGWAVTERSSGKRITSGPEGTEHGAADQLERQLKLHGKEALLRVLGKGRLSS
jgi:hypothetical protein